MKKKSRRSRREKLIGSISFNKGSGLKNRQMARPSTTLHSSSLSTKSKKKRSSPSLHKRQATKLRLGLPNVLNKNISIPPVLCAILYPSHSKRPRQSKRKR